MERFVKRFGDRIRGIITGPDRILIRGVLGALNYLAGLEVFLRSHHVLNKDFVAFAQAATQRIREHAEAMAREKGRPFHYLECSRDSKEEYARMVMERDGIGEGLICVLSCVEPCQTFRVRRNREKRTLELVPLRGKCLHLYFYLVDREFGFMHIRLQTWLPFTIQVCLNGREWLARRMNQRGIGYEQRDNCFPRIDRIQLAQQMLDSLTTRKWVGRLNAWARRTNRWLQTREGRSLRGYYWCVREDELATDVMFRDAESLAQIYPALVRHAIEHFDTDNVLRFFGHSAPRRFRGEVRSQLVRRSQGVRVKHWVQENSVKMYDKQGSVLRIETTINNARRFRVYRRCRRKGQSCMGWLPLRKGIVDYRRRTEIARGINARYLDALSVVAEHSPAHRLLDPVSEAVTRGGRRYRALRPIDPREHGCLAVLLEAQHWVHGFRNRDLHTRWVAPQPPGSEPALRRRRISGQVSRWLQLLRAHGLIHKLPGTQLYRLNRKGHLLITASARMRQHDLASVAA